MLRFLRMLRFGVGGVVAALLAAMLGVGSNLWTYERLTGETPVGLISFTRVAPENYRATLTLATGRVEHFELLGDEWRLDTRVLKWKAWATLLGRDTLFELDRISGRYSNIQQARSAPRSIYNLRPESWFDVWSWSREHPDLAFMVDASYGSSVFLPMADHAAYRISMSTTGVLARPINRSARQALQ